MKWNIDSERPVYIQLIEQIQAGIVSGLFRPGDRLPSVRDLAAEARVNPNTMQRALSELERTHLIYTQRTNGRYITSDLEMIKELKRQSAQELIMDFLEKMKQLGLENDETLEMMTKTVKEMKE
ncbi:GntR family transcriptional regulator [Irregularibacter muris]|uniref:GntR family transcriptional regulator n=1 Tax=Irregularibacter muris TaxID=1796619 RepID=A0AAE3L3I8_9FIRM|nr:GntR family transcriptional regulator [Irregularibacter muris]MCR1898338.1 GntR family transcriptional regulator [Irregularibacter muris]